MRKDIQVVIHNLIGKTSSLLAGEKFLRNLLEQGKERYSEDNGEDLATLIDETLKAINELWGTLKSELNEKCNKEYRK